MEISDKNLQLSNFEKSRKIQNEVRKSIEVENSEQQVRKTFTLNSKASGQYKNQRVKLVLEEPILGTTKWKRYKDFYFSLNISFTNDFDDF